MPRNAMDGPGREGQTSIPSYILGWVTTTIVVLIGATVFFGSWYTIDQTQRGVLLRNGAFVEVVQPGLHFKLPWIESVYKIDMQTHTRIWDKMESYSADQQPASLKVSVTLHVSADKVAELYSRFAGDWDGALARLISPHVPERTKVVFGQYTAARAISARGQLNADTSKAVIAVTQANGRANSVRAEAQAQADAIKLRGNAEAEAIQARGKALGDNPHLVALVQAEKWNGILPTHMLPSGTLPMLNVGTK